MKESEVKSIVKESPACEKASESASTPTLTLTSTVDSNSSQSSSPQSKKTTDVVETKPRPVLPKSPSLGNDMTPTPPGILVNEGSSSSVQRKAAKYLLLLDVNGTLCHRVTKRLHNQPQQDFKYKTYFVYRRPLAQSFMSFLRVCEEQGLVEVFFYTSMLRRNGQGMLRKLLPGDKNEHYQHRVFDRPMNRFVRLEDGSFEPVRDLSKVWASFPDRCYGPANTILVDDSLEKCHDRTVRHNCIIIDQLIDEENLTINTSDNTLHKLYAYLSELIEQDSANGASSGDVREFLKTNPYRSFNVPPIEPFLCDPPRVPVVGDHLSQQDQNSKNESKEEAKFIEKCLSDLIGLSLSPKSNDQPNAGAVNANEPGEGNTSLSKGTSAEQEKEEVVNDKEEKHAVEKEDVCATPKSDSAESCSVEVGNVGSQASAS